MLRLKSYAGSIVLAGLILQGCGGGGASDGATPVDVSQEALTQAKKLNLASDVFATAFDTNASLKTQVTSDLSMKIAQLYKSNADVKKFVDDLMVAHSTELTTLKDAFDAIAAAITSKTNSVSSSKARGLLGNITAPLTGAVKDTLVNALDTKVGNAVTGAAFDVVLNSEGVTVVMLDAARKSETTAQIMVDALEAKWELTEKMCPMLRESTEFGEKFTALAEENEVVAKFFFERIDANMYNCLADAMLLSNNENVHDDSVSHSTNGYMGVLMDRYAADYFIMPTGSTEDRRADKFVSLLLNTGAVANYDAASKTFSGHGDGNELINEKFFYSLFKTPTSTASFVSAMDKVDPETKKMLMDNIFTGTNPDNNSTDTVQGYLNIISIGSAMYDGIYGEVGADGTRSGGYGFGSYVGSFVNFALLIPSDRYMTYGKAFVNAAYEYALFHGIDVWAGVSEAAKTAWNNFATSSSVSSSSARSAGAGVTGSDWYDDIKDIMGQAWSNVSLSDIYNSLMGGDTSVVTTLQDQSNIAYDTFVDGRDANGTKKYPTDITNPATVHNDTVYGLHGLVELAVQEDVFAVHCGSRATDYYLSGYECTNDANYTMTDAKAAFTLPPVSELTWSYAYNAATAGAITYFNNNVNAAWFADLSTNDLIRQYFYPSADNIYIPNWMLAIDWLSLPANVTKAEIAATDFDFNAGYFDIYVTSPNDHLLVDTTTEPVVSADIELANIVSLIKDINVTRVDMGDDSIIAVGNDGQTLDDLYVYKVRTISPEDTQAILAYLATLQDSALSAIGLDSSNAGLVDTTDVNTTAN